MAQKTSIPQDTVCFLCHATQLILGRSTEVPPPDFKQAFKLLQIFSTNTEALTFIYEQVLFENSLSHLAKNVGFSIKTVLQCPNNNCIGSNFSIWEVTNHKLPTIYQITLVVQSLRNFSVGYGTVLHEDEGGMFFQNIRNQ
jgi:hypothetical protein